MDKKFWTITALLALFLVLFSFFKINLPTADIGRHIINGDIFLHSSEYGISKSDLLNTNLFSYTQPSYSFTNHHWGSGILIYLIFSTFGFGGLSIIYFLLILGAFIFVLCSVYEKNNAKILFLISIFVIPLIAGRPEVRPEGLSYFLLALFLYILYKYTNDKLPAKILWILPLLELIWVNTHIYFIFGPFLIGMFFGQELVFRGIKKVKEKIKNLAMILGGSIFAMCINPYGTKGVLYPFTIFQNYGYRIVENQSIGFLEHLSFVNPEFLWYKITIFFVILSSIFVIIKQKKNSLKIYPWALTGISLTFAVLAYLGIRHIPSFVLFSLPLLIYNLSFIKDIFQEKINTLDKDWRNIIFGFIFIITITATMLQFSTKLPWNRNSGIGIDQKQIIPITFIKENKIHGPFFNNYDIGGMMIFGLFPTEHVFVDNRPEAYSKEFFKNIYISIQEDENRWKEENEKQKFNAIFFYRLDYTPWAQKFLLERIKDPLWAPIFVDAQTIIFLARNKKNSEIIKKYELPKEMFGLKR